MSIFGKLLKPVGSVVGAGGGVLLKVVPRPVKRWVASKIAGLAASKVGGVLREQVEREKAMNAIPAAVTKPGYKTTEFWLTMLAQLVGLAYQAGIVVDHTVFGKIIALVVMALAAAGYSVSRGLVKGKAITIETFGTVSDDPTAR